MEYTPYDYQRTMIQWLLDHKQAALFCSPGLGKTGVSLAAYDEHHLAGSKGMLVVAPIRVCATTWYTETFKWEFCRHWTVANLRTPEGIKHWHKGTADIYLINSEMLPTREVRTNCPDCKDVSGKREHCIECNGDGKITRKHFGFVAKYLKGKKASELPVDVLLIDELSLAKSHTSKRFNALRAYRSMFKAIWVDALNLNDPAIVAATWQAAGFEPEALMALASAAVTKEALKATTQQAVERGVFGAPTFFVGDQMFWGQDRFDFVKEALQ